MIVRITFLMTLFFFTSCRTKKNIQGSYADKYISNGFFKSLLKLNVDSTFEFRFVGDLINDVGVGRYRVDKKNHLNLIFTTPEIDTFYFKDSTIRTHEEWNNKILKIKFDTIRFLKPQLHYNHFHNTFKIKNNGEIISVDSNGQKYKRRRIYYTKTPRFILWGTHWRKKRNPLIKYSETIKE